MLDWWSKNFALCQLGELPEAAALRYRRLNRRATEIGKILSQGFGKAFSEVFNGANALKRAYEFLPTQKQNLPN
jgi:hypothetical protein